MVTIIAVTANVYRVSTYYVPVTILNLLHVLTLFNPYNKYCEVLLPSLLYKQGSSGKERLRSTVKVT